MKNINIPIDTNTIKTLRFKDEVLLTGTIYTGRDAAHKRLVAAIANKETPPFDLKNAIIYYVGPSPARPSYPIGAAGPTTSARMDNYAKVLIPLGLKIMIGKGQRSEEIKELIKEHQGLYLAATGGIAALIAKSIKSAQLIAYPDLGPEAIYRLEVKNFPAIVAYDTFGGDLYQSAIKEYKK